MTIRNTTELRRILQLPQRDPYKIGEYMVPSLTEELKLPGGDMALRPLQALALSEAAVYGGSIVLLSVGGGKTLISYLAPTLLKADRPLLLVPGGHRKKTVKEFWELEEHWKKPEKLIVESYEKTLSKEYLFDYKPDLIIADECHKLKNRKAGITRHLFRYAQENSFKFIPMSGTLTKRSFDDWWHLMRWALPRELQPLPGDYRESIMWGEAMDEKLKMRRPLDALKVFGPTLKEARKGYGKLLSQVPGVITAPSPDVDASIYLKIKKIESKTIKDAIKKMSKTWELPDGTEFSEATEWWRHSVEMSQGFYYRWKEQPPEEWLAARAMFNKAIRHKLRYSRKYDTPGQVVEANPDMPEYLQWKEIEKTFTPVTEAVWFCEDVIDYAKKFKGLIWTEHKAVGQKLAGKDYFSSNGENEKKTHIYDFRGDRAVVSINAISEGFNLQSWDKNLILSPPSSGDKFEQLMGRTHRQGQKSDSVYFEVIQTDRVLQVNFEQAKKDAEYIENITSQKQKLNLADILE
jgi:hypothetical protein